MAAEWANLPSVVLYDLFGYLTLKDRVSASSTCKKWRDAFFLYPNWRKFEASTAHCDTKKNEFLFRKGSRFCKSLLITYVLEDFKEVTQLLKCWSNSSRLNELQLIGCGTAGKTFPAQFEAQILPLLNRLSRMSSLFLYHISDMPSLEKIILKNKDTLISLGLGQAIPTYIINPLLSINFQSTKLKVLLLDGKWVTDELLLHISSNIPTLKILVLSLDQENSVGSIPVETWQTFKERLPTCRIRVNYHRMTDVEEENSPCPTILTKASNLTHIRMIYCSRVFQEKCINTLMRERSLLHSVTSIWSISDISKRDLFERHPFVVCAWRFKHLKEMVLSGCLFDDYDLVGMSRMRPSLNIQIAAEDIAVDFRPISQAQLSTLLGELSDPVSGQLWSPMEPKRFNDPSLPPRDRESLVLREILRDDLKTIC